MPRQARIDAPGALHHITLRGFEQKPIFKDQQDYTNFLKRLSHILTEAKYDKSGHAVISRKYKYRWKDTEYVLRRFGKTVRAARRFYTAFVTKGIGQGRRPELVGGGLIRSFGGWSALKASRFTGLQVMGDERILGSGEFVESVLNRAKEDYEKRVKAQVKGFDLDTLIEQISEYFEIEAELIKSTAKQRQASRARSLLCYLAVSRLNVSGAEIARKLNVSPSTVSKCIYRGQSDELSKKFEKDLFDW